MDLLRAHALLDAVDSGLSWGFTTRRDLPVGSIRTGDRRTGGVVAELLEALEAVSVDDLHTLSAPELLDRARSLVTVINRAQAELSRTVRRAELAQAFEHDGMKSPQAWLRGHCRLSPAAAGQVVRNGRALELLPAVAEAAAAGQVTAEQVTVIGKITTPRNLALLAEQNRDLAGIGQVLAEFAATRAHDELARLVHVLQERLDQDGPEPDPTAQRSLSYARLPDGSLTGRFSLDAAGGEKVQAAIESILQANRPAGDTRTRAQRQADALVQLCDIQLASGNLPTLRQVKPHAMVVIPAEDLLDPATGPATAEMGFGAVVSAARARWVACDADITRIVLDPDGVPLDVGRTQRLVTPALRRAVEARDRHCVFAGCGAPTWWCEVHHLIEWALGGETSLENSGLLCERHHTQVHHGFRVERDSAGRWHTYRPDGTEIHVIRPPTPADDETLARTG
jgi:Domain of unknown function (DUF222)/HNH endonuclease